MLLFLMYGMKAFPMNSYQHSDFIHPFSVFPMKKPSGTDLTMSSGTLLNGYMIAGVIIAPFAQNVPTNVNVDFSGPGASS